MTEKINKYDGIDHPKVNQFTKTTVVDLLGHALVKECLHIAIHLTGIMGRISERFKRTSTMLPFLLITGYI